MIVIYRISRIDDGVFMYLPYQKTLGNITFDLSTQLERKQYSNKGDICLYLVSKFQKDTFKIDFIVPIQNPFHPTLDSLSYKVKPKNQILEPF